MPIFVFSSFATQTLIAERTYAVQAHTREGAFDLLERLQSQAQDRCVPISHSDIRRVCRLPVLADGHPFSVNFNEPPDEFDAVSDLDPRAPSDSDSWLEEIDPVTGERIEPTQAQGEKTDTLGHPQPIDMSAELLRLRAALDHIERACVPGVDQSDDDLEAFISSVAAICAAARRGEAA